MLRHGSRWHRAAGAAALVAGMAGAPAEGVAQGDPTGGSPAGAVAGGALGLASGAVLAVAGSIIPCTETAAGARCVRIAALAGGAIGLVGGALAGATRRDWINGPATSAGLGFLAGSATGIAIWPIVERFSWLDVLTLGLAGSAIGASPEGAGVGFGVGAAAGLLALALDRRHVTIVDALSGAMAGLAIGGLGEWVARGLEGGGGGTVLLARVRW